MVSVGYSLLFMPPQSVRCLSRLPSRFLSIPCLEACTVNQSQIRTLEYVLNNTFRKIFATKSFDIATDCIIFWLRSLGHCRRKSKFLTKVKYKTTSSLLSFISTVHCLFHCLFKLFVCILIFCYHLW